MNTRKSVRITSEVGAAYGLREGSVTTLVDVAGTSAATLFGVGSEFGQDGWGDYWGKPAPGFEGIVCIGLPGLSFEFVDD